ncbi:hypothetical protein Cgig2_028625 [Carnegiea gigantea]|uniref:Protein FAR1-RELATED SEQUENCE n=1 Tax=Carnegiea gigantea TaxID=171969 RepID=A0A9Q1K7D7_9CARY|nr:hypothetical protein Cgig2_028625 [Carnegiea gigantea]
MESVQWLFNSFLIAMANHMPKIVITNQNPTIRQAIADVFETSIHRLCIWHIMRKLPNMVGCMLNGCEDFIECIKGCVWASNSPDEFEESWGEMLEEFDLADNEWLCHTYEIRELWVHAMKSQRHCEHKAENASLTSLLKLKMSYEIEKHVRNIYTHTNFYVFQRQLYIGRMYCHVQGTTNVEGDRTYQIKHNYESKTRIHYVVYNECTSECQCSCHIFDSDEIPCAHMLLVFTSNSLREILASYIINRWTKIAAKAPMYEFDNIMGDAYGEIAT